MHRAPPRAVVADAHGDVVDGGPGNDAIGARDRVPARAAVTARLGGTIVARGTGAGVVGLKLTARGRRLLEHRRHVEDHRRRLAADRAASVGSREVMEKTPESAPLQVSPEVAAPSVAPVLAASVARVLALQRSAGNAAVTRMLQREEQQAGRVDTPVGIVYAKPDMSSEHVAELPHDAPVPVKGKSGDFWVVDQGYVYWADVAVTAAPDPAAPAAAATLDKNDWRQVLPEAQAKGGKGLGNQSGHSSAHGDLVAYRAGKGNVPAVTYNERKGEEIAEAGPLPDGVTQADVDAVAAKVAGARGNVRDRFMRLTQSDVKGADFYGYESTPKLDQGLESNKGRSAQQFKAQDEHWQDTVDASSAYLAWLNDPKTKPSQCSDPGDMRWKVFKRMMDWEGMTSAVNTFDKANVTLGAGFAGSAGGAVQPKGQAQELMGDLFTRSPAVAGMFLAAGLTVADGGFVVVDTERKWKLKGMDAELYVRANKDLMSLYVNVAQGAFLEDRTKGVDPKTQPGADNDARQAVLDANFQTFLGHALASNPPLGSDVDLAALKVHAAHSGFLNWGQVGGYGDIASLVKFIYGAVSRQRAEAIVVEPKWRAMAPPG
jgi:hypothetical protein